MEACSFLHDGSLVKVQYDTLRYISTWKSLADDLIWWKSNISVGLPEMLYANDSAFFELQNRMFTPDVIDARKDYSLFPGDSVHYLASFEDNTAQGRSVKMLLSRQIFKTEWLLQRKYPIQIAIGIQRPQKILFSGGNESYY